jgi:hypothetical protein
MRFKESESLWMPVALSDEAAFASYSPASIPIRSEMCFDHVIFRKCNKCFYSSVSRQTVKAFKSAAYKLYGVNMNSTSDKKSDLKVSIFQRGLHYREMDDPDKLKRFLLSSFPDKKLLVDIHVFDSESETPQEQIKFVASADVIIATHGAFESNIVYMRNGALVIELTGVYDDGVIQESRNFENLAMMFLVHHIRVIVSSLQSHRQKRYFLSEDNLNVIAGIIKRAYYGGV